MTMHVYHLRIFQREVARQCDFAFMAHNDLVQALNQLEGAPRGETDNWNRIWYSIQSLLVASANTSKLLWPERKFDLRGQQLRSSLKVPQDSSLKSRDFRNHFEYFDERLEDGLTRHKATISLIQILDLCQRRLNLLIINVISILLPIHLHSEEKVMN
jgi:hypothetical protein